MQTPLQITFRNLTRSEAAEAKVREYVENLEKYCDFIISCRVMVEIAHKHHLHGNQYRVRVDITVPHKELVASREPDEHHAYTDMYVAIRDAFETMRRLLEDYVTRQRREIKTHAVLPRGRIA